MNYQRDISNLFLLSDSKTRSISAENSTGEPGMGARAQIPPEAADSHPAHDLGIGWKVKPYLPFPKKSTLALGEINGSGVIRHIWITTPLPLRHVVLRIYWDGSKTPSVECPLGDFFFLGWDKYFHINGATVAVNAARAMNCFWSMPFRKNARFTLENLTAEDQYVFYQIDYEMTALPENIGYFHAQFRRSNPLPYKTEHIVLDGVSGKGQFVGTYLAYGSRNNGWWGEGEIKFFMDGDEEFPTICGTGTEDYFLAAYNFENTDTKNYEDFSGLYSGFYRVPTDNLYKQQARFGMYRIHLNDPIFFDKDIRVTLQSLGWKKDGRFNPQRDDLATIAFWYLDKPLEKRCPLPDADGLEII
ncbi:MAG: DUF2961 domain-containing protein [Clostridiales bacterium]|jgi:hypothetical protein|nr:DUF2961 domain-containing protein [Clostridiales bacterium]